MHHPLGIIGFGRFGQLLAKLLSSPLPIRVYDPLMTQHSQLDPSIQFTDLAEVAACSTIFIAVPIRHFEITVEQLAQQLLPLSAGRSAPTIIDVCSVKVYPAQMMQTWLPPPITLIATHPLFGPDSWPAKPPASLPKMMMYPLQGDRQPVYAEWQQYFSQQGIEIIEMTPEQHDQFAARSQSLTHFIGRSLEKMQLEPTPIDTLGFQHLFNLMRQTCNDSWELFTDLQRYNPYTHASIQALIDAAQSLQDYLQQQPNPLPPMTRSSPDHADTN